MEKLKNWTDAGMNLDDKSYINACSGIVNRGCYNPPCGGNAMDGGAARAANFAKVMKALKISANFEEDEDMDFYIKKAQDVNEASPDNKNHWARDNMPPETFEFIKPQPIYRHVDDEVTDDAVTIDDTVELIKEKLLDNVEKVLEKVEEELL